MKRSVARTFLLGLLVIIPNGVRCIAGIDLSIYYPNPQRLVPGTLTPLINDQSVNDVSASEVDEVFKACDLEFAQQLVANAQNQVNAEDAASSSFNKTDAAGNANPSISAHYLSLSSDSSTKPANTAGRVAQYILVDLLDDFKNKSAGFQQACQDFIIANLNRTQIGGCSVSLTCDPSNEYRSANGSCNNLGHPNFGISASRLQRFTSTAYDDGVGHPRTLSVNGGSLPSARAVTNWIVSRQTYFDPKISHFVMQWGQFLDHDMSVSPMVTSPDGTPIVCCAEDLRSILNLTQIEVDDLQQQLNQRPECFNIAVPFDDSRFRNRTCVNFVRSSAAPSDDCAPRHREQLNSLTSYVDASMIYGSNQQQQNNLRSFSGGLLRVQKMASHGDLMPTSVGQTCHNSLDSNECFIAGDSRANEQPALASIHTIFVREHNSITTRLAAINPQWNDETLFQETCRIVGALVQHITFNEFMPVIVGTTLSAAHGLDPLNAGYYTGYNDQVDASIRTEFSTVAFRFGHTLLRDCFSLADPKYNVMGCFRLRDAFFKPDAVYNGTTYGCNGIIRGLLADPAQHFDRRITAEVVDHLFTSGNPSPLDLPAFNIQRARDHGIPSYVELRRIFGMTVPIDFDDLNTTHDGYVIYLFKRVYQNVSDIDAFAGGVSETPLPGAVLGPMFAKIMALQLQLAKTGDRFYYEGNAAPKPFTLAQLKELRSATLARVLCANADLATIQRNPLLVSSQRNPRVSCSTFPSMDLNQWAE